MRLAVFQPDIAANLGAMIRICACFGVPLDVIEPCGFALSQKALRRAAMDYAALADVKRHDSWPDFHAGLGASRLVLATTGGAEDLWDFHFQPGDCLLMGRESAGVPPEVHELADARVRLPMPGGGRSLNVAVTAGIMLAEASRQSRPAA